jgi:hypothetical protein
MIILQNMTYECLWPVDNSRVEAYHNLTNGYAGVNVGRDAV